MNSPEESLHVAVCQAVSLLNVSTEIVRISEGRQVRDILRKALADYADAFMNQPTSEAEQMAVRRNYVASKKGGE